MVYPDKAQVYRGLSLLLQRVDRTRDYFDTEIILTRIRDAYWNENYREALEYIEILSEQEQKTLPVKLVLDCYAQLCPEYVM